jgi:S-adenosylmethionine hydrolase
VVAPRATHLITDPAFRRPVVSSTFHGRDLFAVTAARLAAGAPIAAVGPPVTLAPRAPGPRGRVIHVDRFGNAITDLRDVAPDARVAAGSFRVSGVSRTYEDVPRGRPLAYVGSAGTLELAVREGSAAKRFGLRRGTRVSLGPGGRRGPGRG